MVGKQKIIGFWCGGREVSTDSTPSRTCVSFMGPLDGRLAAVEDNNWLMSDQTMDLWILLEEEEDDDRNGVWSLMQKIVVPSFRIDVGLEAQPPGMAYPKRLFGALETIHGGQLVIVWHANWGEEAYLCFVL